MNPTVQRRTMLMLICGAIAASPAVATTRAPDALRQLIHDPKTGLALHGYDPVAYHSEALARVGQERFATEALGFVWRFVSAANRAAFLESPDAYLPLFGGHDARGVAEGRLVEGDPAIFLISGDRAVFFRQTADRDAYATDADMRRKSLANWREVALQFAGH